MLGQALVKMGSICEGVIKARSMEVEKNENYLEMLGEPLWHTRRQVCSSKEKHALVLVFFFFLSFHGDSWTYWLPNLTYSKISQIYLSSYKFPRKISSWVEEKCPISASHWERATTSWLWSLLPAGQWAHVSYPLVSQKSITAQMSLVWLHRVVEVLGDKWAKKPRTRL